MVDSVMMTDKREIKTESIRTLLFRSGKAATIINLITLYRIVTFPLLILLIVIHAWDIFKWFLLASFFTDAIDGFLARKYKVKSILGAKLDSIGDDLTVLAAAIGLFVGHFEFIRQELILLLIVFTLFLIQLVFSLIRYKKISSFHTYMAKTAAVVTALFLLSVFFLDKIIYPLFYTACIITSLELIEEMILVYLLPEWKTNVSGIYYVLKHKRG